MSLCIVIKVKCNIQWNENALLNKIHQCIYTEREEEREKKEKNQEHLDAKGTLKIPSLMRQNLLVEYFL